MKRISVVGLLGLLAATPQLADAETLAAKDIIQKSIDQQVFRAQGVELEMAMRLRNKRGETRDRSLFARSRRKDDLSRTLVRFVSPADVSGTSFLFLENKDRDDDQYMYLPALKATRRIVGSQKNSSFMGSDFTYADMEWGSLEEATYTSLADEAIDGAPCFVIQATPNNKESYTKLKVWVRKKDFVMVRLEFYDLKNQLEKVLSVAEVQPVDGALMATKLKMENVQDGHLTLIAMTKIRVRHDFADDDFTVRALEH